MKSKWVRSIYKLVLVGGPVLTAASLVIHLEVERYSVIKMHKRNNLTLFLRFLFIVRTMLNVFYRDLFGFKMSLGMSSLAEKPDRWFHHQVSCRFNFHGGRSNMSQKCLMGGRDFQWFDFIRAVNPVASVMIYFHGFIANRVSFIENICFFNVFSIKDINPRSPQNFLTRIFLWK